MTSSRRCCGVLFLCEYGSVNGGENSLLAVLPELQHRGLQVAVMAPRDSDLATRLSALNIELVYSQLVSTMSLAEKRQSLATLFATLRPSLVHSNSLAMGRIAGVVATEFGIPCVAHLRDIVKLSRAAVSDINAHSVLIAVSEAVRNAHLQQGIDADKTRVIYNCIDSHTFSPRAPTQFLHRELGLPDDAILIATIGQLSLRKGVASIPAIHAAVCEQLPATHPPIHWLIIGRRWSEKDESQQIEQNLIKQCNSVSDSDCIHLLGERSDIAAILSELTLYVHTAWMEPFGRVLLEAASARVAVVARDVGGTREIFGGDDAVTLAETDDQLANNIVALLLDAARRNKQYTAARERVTKCFTVDNTATAICEIYAEVCERA